jgi:L-aminopeptidase/D-esterase-like protein
VITEVAGIRCGHWTDADAQTGCTVVLFPEGTVASAEVRGGAPASRELDLLAPGRLVQRIDALLLTGGSAFGLAAADGVMRFCEEHGLGHPTAGGVVPIVPALALYDLAVGDATVRPGAEQGHAACVAAISGPVEVGAVGAGTGARVNKWRGADGARPGGVVTATRRAGGLVVSALLAVNAFGDIDADGNALAVAADLLGAATGSLALVTDATVNTGANTTIGLIVTNAALDKLGCLALAQAGHGALARAIVPSHTSVDGDALVAAATGDLDLAEAGADLDAVRLLAAAAVEAAVRSL